MSIKKGTQYFDKNLKINLCISQVSQPLAGAVLDLVEGRGRTPKSSSSAPLLGIRPILISFQTYSCFIFYLHLFCSLNETYFDHLKIIFPYDRFGQHEKVKVLDMYLWIS